MHVKWVRVGAAAQDGWRAGGSGRVRPYLSLLRGPLLLLPLVLMVLLLLLD